MIKEMIRKILPLMFAGLLICGFGGQARAELFAVSADPAIAGSVFPLWYQDFSDSAVSEDANPNYGIGPDAGGLKLELCLDQNGLCLLENPNAAAPIAFPDNFGPEAFWWTGEAAMPIATTGGGLLVLALEAAFDPEVIAAGNEVAFGRVRIRIDVPVVGTYTVTHPYGVEVFEVTEIDPGNEINVTEDIGIGAGFAGALASNVGPFLFWDADLPVTDVDTLDAFYIGNPAIGHRVLGSPLGTNFFRIDGPEGSNLDGAGNDFVETDLFAVSGKVFTDGVLANTAPTAVPDATATLAGTPVVIDVLGNDFFTDVPINPGSLTMAQPTGGTAAMTVIDGQVRATYTPNAGFTGVDTFTYTVTGFGGMESAPATVTVTVEDLQVTKAEFRPKLMKWRISGTSTDTTLNEIDIEAGPPTVSATLSGAQEVPNPVVTSGSGSVSVTVTPAGIDFTLAISGLLNITETHLHLGSAGQNGPVLFTLAGANVANRSATLTAADLRLTSDVTFDEAIEAILSGNAYIQVHTQAVSSGELRGNLGPVRIVGTAPVQPGGSWVFEGKSRAVPDAGRTISVRSSNGVTATDIPLKVK
jgi:hypothetical protein